MSQWLSDGATQAADLAKAGVCKGSFGSVSKCFCKTGRMDYSREDAKRECPDRMFKLWEQEHPEKPGSAVAKQIDKVQKEANIQSEIQDEVATQIFSGKAPIMAEMTKDQLYVASQLADKQLADEQRERKTAEMIGKHKLKLKQHEAIQKKIEKRFRQLEAQQPHLAMRVHKTKALFWSKIDTLPADVKDQVRDLIGTCANTPESCGCVGPVDKCKSSPADCVEWVLPKGMNAGADQYTRTAAQICDREWRQFQNVIEMNNDNDAASGKLREEADALEARGEELRRELAQMEAASKKAQAEEELDDGGELDAPTVITEEDQIWLWGEDPIEFNEADMIANSPGRMVTEDVENVPGLDLNGPKYPNAIARGYYREKQYEGWSGIHAINSVLCNFKYKKSIQNAGVSVGPPVTYKDMLNFWRARRDVARAAALPTDDMYPDVPTDHKGYFPPDVVFSALADRMPRAGSETATPVAHIIAYPRDSACELDKAGAWFPTQRNAKAMCFDRMVSLYLQFGKDSDDSHNEPLDAEMQLDERPADFANSRKNIGTLLRDWEPGTADTPATIDNEAFFEQLQWMVCFTGGHYYTLIREQSKPGSQLWYNLDSVTSNEPLTHGDLLHWEELSQRECVSLIIPTRRDQPSDTAFHGPIAEGSPTSPSGYQRHCKESVPVKGREFLRLIGAAKYTPV